MRFQSLDEWLAWMQPPTHIDLGLARCREVAERMGLLKPDYFLFTVAGTNGKGSSATLLDHILRAAGYRCGRFLSPHILRYNERYHLQGKEASDEELCAAFEAIDQARGEIKVTNFEFSLLAALYLFQQHQLEVAVLEVGLGGRLDAANIIDADVALITSISLDHQEYLGDTREKIAYEKAGIMRAQRPAVCSDPDAPQSLQEYAQVVGASLRCLGKDFNFLHQPGDAHWEWRSRSGKVYKKLPLPALAGAYQVQNAAGVLAALEAAQAQLVVNEVAIHQGLQDFYLPGRLQRLKHLPVPVLLDVAHNPSGAEALAQALMPLSDAGQRHAIVGMLNTKDSVGSLKPLIDKVDVWHVCPLNHPQSRSVQELMDILHAQGALYCIDHESVNMAYQLLQEQLGKQDEILIFGSFNTVAEVLPMPTS